MDGFDAKPRISGSSAAANMRAQLQGGCAPQPVSRAIPPNPPPHPPPKRAKRDEAYEERAERAERLSRAQHTTSLLKSPPEKTRHERELEAKKPGGLALQILAVMAIAGGLAFALDPTLMRHVRPLADEALRQISLVAAQLGV